MNKEQKAFKSFLVKHTGCTIQDGYPCGTCTMALLDKLGLDSRTKSYKEHNKPVERGNEVWRAILQIRDASLGSGENENK